MASPAGLAWQLLRNCWPPVAAGSERVHVALGRARPGTLAASWHDLSPSRPTSKRADHEIVAGRGASSQREVAVVESECACSAQY